MQDLNCSNIYKKYQKKVKKREIIIMTHEAMLKKEQYESKKDFLHVLRADGDLALLCTLRAKFDDTLDAFFDSKEIRANYENAWDYENDTFNTDVSNTDLMESLNDIDSRKFCKFLDGEMELLDDEIHNWIGDEGDFKFTPAETGLTFWIGSVRFDCEQLAEITERDGKTIFTQQGTNNMSHTADIEWTPRKEWLEGDREDAGNACDWYEPSSIDVY